MKLLLAIASLFLATAMPVQKRGLGTNYEIGRMIGKGTFANVYSARALKLGLNVVVKRQKVAGVSNMEFENELEMLLKLSNTSSTNVIRYIDSFKSLDRKINIVLEKAPGGELYEFFQENFDSLSIVWKQKVFKDMVIALKQVHDAGICHRDVKMENFLLMSSNPTDYPYPQHLLKISDFGLSSTANEGLLHRGTLEYVSTELAQAILHRDKEGSDFDCKKNDIWALGVVFRMLLTQEVTFDPSEDLIEQYGHKLALLHSVAQGNYSVPQSIFGDPDAIMILKRCLEPIPELRASVDELMNLKWLNDPKDLKIYSKDTSMRSAVVKTPSARLFGETSNQAWNSPSPDGGHFDSILETDYSICLSCFGPFKWHNKNTDLL